MTRIAVITGSTRPGRQALDVAQWVLGIASEREDASFELVDIAEFELPLLDEEAPAMMGDYRHDHTKAWAAKIAPFDGFVFVTPEYNHSTSAALKNAIDYLYAEWNNKAAGFVSYGVGPGGTRAVEHLRLVMGELKVADVRSQLALSFAEDFEEMSKFNPREHQAEQLTTVLDDLIGWAEALRGLRESEDTEK